MGYFRIVEETISPQVLSNTYVLEGGIARVYDMPTAPPVGGRWVEVVRYYFHPDERVWKVLQKARCFVPQGETENAENAVNRLLDENTSTLVEDTGTSLIESPKNPARVRVVNGSGNNLYAWALDVERLLDQLNADGVQYGEHTVPAKWYFPLSLSHHSLI